MNINSNHSNLAFDQEVSNPKNWLQSQITDTCGYSSEVLLDRLMQRLVEIGIGPYALIVSGLCKNSSNCRLPAAGTKIDCSRAFMEIGSGRITLTLKQWLSNQLDFFLHWMLCLVAILFSKRAENDDSQAILILGVAEESLFRDGNDEQFINYCRLGPILPLRNGKRIFIQSTSKNVFSCNPDITYSRNPLISFLREVKLGFLGRFQLLINHLILFFAYTFAVLRLPPLSLIGKDFAYSAISFELDKRRLIRSLILTCSCCTTQQLWMRTWRHSKVHMIWYAQNWRPIAYSVDKLISDVPNLRWMRVDTHWVWTHAFAEYLRTLGQGKDIEIVGPIVWSLPEIVTPSADAIKIVIFDVSPYHDDIALGNGEISNYNHPDNLFSFIQDTISLKLGIEETFHMPVSFRLKTKRGHQADYDRAYFDHLNKLDSLGVIFLEHYSTNIYSLISGSHLVIAYPFTSPAYIAEALNVPTIYYDPTKSVLRQDFGDSPSLVNFANCPDDLLKAAITALSSNLSDEATVKESGTVGS